MNLHEETSETSHELDYIYFGESDDDGGDNLSDSDYDDGGDNLSDSDYDDGGDNLSDSDYDDNI